MKATKYIAGILYYISRLAAWVFIVTVLYAITVLALAKNTGATWLPVSVSENGTFTIFIPFTHAPFLLGEYNGSYIGFYFVTMAFYGLFLWLLSDVFHAFKQTKLFTRKGVVQLSRFYIMNMSVPILFLILLLLLRGDFSDIVQISFLHLIIGVFAFFMASIFKQGLLLQEEQDLTF